MQPSQLVFVVHKHKATSLHYDFRLEIDGVLQSWAIPKGPTLDNTVKRLAMQTTDHPMNYRHFEGIIKEGSYGTGPVMIWDEGYYIPEIEIAKDIRKEITNQKEATSVMKKGLENGELKFVLYGKKLHGSFALVKTKGWGPKNSWLLIKHDDKYVEKAYDANTYDFSAISERSLLGIEKEK